MLKDKKICMVGTGNMGTALVAGLIQSGASSPENLVCTDVSDERLAFVKDKYGTETIRNNVEAVAAADIVIYAVKPQFMASVLKETREALDMSKLVISIAAGVPLIAIETVLQKELRLIRVMPNVAVSIKAGATAIAAGRHVADGDPDLAKAVFDSVGESVFIPENLMDAVTGLSGSGPAYIFVIAEALADAGVKAGLPRNEAHLLATQTILGAAAMMRETGEHPGKLKDMVTSPGGTTIAGLHKLEEGGLRASLINAVEAAVNRSAELGETMMENFEKSG